jgi:hypothetical protein
LIVNPKPLRKANWYRIFSNVHVDQFRLARTAFIIEVVRLSAKGQYDNAIALRNVYIDIVKSEIANANEAMEITNTFLKGSFQG